ncbi:MAG: epoxyqueuosine reductase [Promethearchaeota archaeon]
MVIDAETIKKKVIQLGADMCGIANVSRFKNAPKGFHPRDIYPECKSVIVYFSHFPLSSLQAKTNSPYTLIRNMMVNKLDLISFHLCDDLEHHRITCVPIPSAEPYDYWDSERKHGRGILSLKHAANLAGLGIIGKNTLLINEKFGNMIWLGAIIVSTELEQDPIPIYDGCNEKCTLCMDSCPQNALDGTTLDQELCRERSISTTEGGSWVLSCNICRKVCPNYKSIHKKQTKK